MDIPASISAIVKVVGEENRYNFDVVHVEDEGVARAHAISTNGELLVAVSWPTPVGPAQVHHIDGKSFEEACKIAKIKKSSTITLPNDSSKTTPYPPYKKFEPVEGSPIRMDLDSLILALETINSILKQPKRKGSQPLRVDLFIPGQEAPESAPIEIRAANDEGVRVTALVPEKRIEQNDSFYSRAI